jgi:perosamine synthetase
MPKPPDYEELLDYHDTPPAGARAGGGYFGQHGHKANAARELEVQRLGAQDLAAEVDAELMRAAPIPFQHPTLGAPEREAVLEVLETGRLTHGARVEELERRCGLELAGGPIVHHAVACSSGTAALHLGLLGLEVTAADSVIVPALTYIATANAVAYTGAELLVADVDPRTWTMDPESAARLAHGARQRGRRVAAAIPVALCGVPADIGALRAALGSDVALLEDAAEAIGVEQHRELAASAYSLHGSKTITAGEGGVLITKDKELAARARLYRGQGHTAAVRHNYIHTVIGYNYRLTELAAAIASAQLSRLSELLERRRELVSVYVRELRAAMSRARGPLPELQEDPGERMPAPWCLGIKLPEPHGHADIQHWLELRGIETRPMFYPIHAQPPYLERVRHDAPVAEELAGRCLLLPLHAELEDLDVKRIVLELALALEGGGR